MFKYTTEDGYMNTVYRVIERKEANKTFIKKFTDDKKNNFKLFSDEAQNVEAKIAEAKSDEVKKKPVIILQHGLLDSFLTFMMNHGESLAFKLVEAGYDVWLNNSRGNRYSKDH